MYYLWEIQARIFGGTVELKPYQYEVQTSIITTIVEAKNIEECLWIFKARSLRGEVIGCRVIGHLTR